jgi:hypothetical protein
MATQTTRQQDSDNLDQQTRQIIAYLQGLLDRKAGRALFDAHQPVLEQVTPREVFTAFYTLYNSGIPIADLLDVLDKSINAFHKALKTYPWQMPEPGYFADYLLIENAGLLERLQAIRLQLVDPDYSPELLLESVSELQQFDDHYQKKENILFPILEQKAPHFQGLAIMWALHDEIRSRLKRAVSCLSDFNCSIEQRNRILGKLIFGMHGMVFKEELILLPAASEVLDQADWLSMLLQSGDYSFPFVVDPPDLETLANTQPVVSIAVDEADRPAADGSNLINPDEVKLMTETGSLTLAEIEQVFAALPVDMTIVDADNKVRFFSRPKDRIFPRSAAIIGRSVENCHPPQSVGRVLEIIDAFRSGRQHQATFWIQMKGRLILIRYFALRKPDGCYLGALEVSQDITDLRNLHGEQRLLSWSEDQPVVNNITEHL